MKSINEWVKAVHDVAKEHGWHDKERETGTIHMLMVSEIAEATEEARKNRPYCYVMTSAGFPIGLDNAYINTKGLKPEGEAIELADCVIRIMDYFGKMGWDLEDAIKCKHEYNKTREYRHGGKAY